MIQGDLHASHVIKDKGEQFQQEVADRLCQVRKGFTSQDVQSCRMSTHGEDIILSPRARAILPITVECKAQKKHSACATWKQAHRQAKELCLSVQPEPVAFIKVDGEVKWSGKIGQRAKVYPTRMNGYENDEATELFRQV